MTSESTHTSSAKYPLPPHSTLEPVPPEAPQYHYKQTAKPPVHAQNIIDDSGTQYPKQTRNPWGLSPTKFGLLVAAITAVVVGGAVGGGLGGAWASDITGDILCTSTATVTASPTAGATAISSAATSLPSASSLSNYLAAEPYYVSSLSSTCDSSTTSITGPSAIYDISCATDFGAGDPAAGDPSLIVTDITALFAYSLLDCVYACDSANRFLGDNGADLGYKCESLTWRTDMAAINATENANCFLKNGTGITSYQCNSCIGAKRRS